MGNTVFHSSGCFEVDQMAQIPLTGNILPPSWYKQLCYENGKPCMAAACILSDIVYWYRPVVERDEKTGETIGYRKKFKEDALQRSYQAYCDMMGLSKKQVREAMDILENKGLIKREFRTIKNGESLYGNILFIKINPEKIHEITCPAIKNKAEEPLLTSKAIGHTKIDRKTNFDTPLLTSKAIGHTKVDKKTPTPENTESFDDISISEDRLPIKNRNTYYPTGQYPIDLQVNTYTENKNTKSFLVSSPKLTATVNEGSDSHPEASACSTEEYCPGDMVLPPRGISGEDASHTLYRRDSYDDILQSRISDDILRNELKEYVRMRSMNNSKLTNHALNALIERLYSISHSDAERAEIVRNATMRCQKDFYPLVGSNPHQTAAFDSSYHGYSMADLENMFVANNSNE